MNEQRKVKAATVQDELDAMDAVNTDRNVHLRLSMARGRFHQLKLKKSGKNNFAGYEYFELADFLIPALQVFRECGLGSVITFAADLAVMYIVNLDNPDNRIIITSPMGSAALKGCHEVQNIGAVETYQRRYLWVAALEIVEHDALDKTTGKDRTFSTGETPPAKRVKLEGPYTSKTQLWGALKAFVHAGNGMSDLGEWIAYRDSKDSQELIEQTKRDFPALWSEGLPDLPEYEPLEVFIARRTRELEEAESLQGAK